MKRNVPANIDDYIDGLVPDTARLMQQLRKAIHKAAPEAVEVISYGMPAFKMDSVLVYFAAYKQHIGLYPTSSGIRVFEAELAEYKYSKGAVQFPLDKPLPLELVQQIVHFRVGEQVEQRRLRNKPDPFMAGFSAPAQRALSAAGIKTAKQLSKYSTAELLQLHGIGPSSIPKLKAAAAAAGLSLKDDQ